MDLEMADETAMSEARKEFDFIDRVSYRNYIFNKPTVLEKDKLKELRLLLRDYNKRKDSSQGIKIHFGPQTDYEAYVSVIDLLAIEYREDYVFYKDDIYVFTIPPKLDERNFKKMPPIEIRDCGYGIANRDYFRELRVQESRAAFFGYLKKNWPLPLSFFALIGINLFSLASFNRNKILYLNGHSQQNS